VNAARNVHNHGGVSSGISAELACTKVMKHKSFVDLTVEATIASIFGKPTV